MKRLVLFAVLPLLAAPAAFASGNGPFPVHDFTITVDGAPAEGIYVRPSGQITRLVVVAHGYGHTVNSWRAHLVDIATKSGALAVAMDYPLGFDGNALGAAETIAAAHHFLAKYPTITETYLFSVSMGNVVGTMVLTQAPGLFDWWIDVEGVSNLFETWAEAKLASPAIATEIEVGCAGTPASSPEAFACYSERSAALQVANIKPGIYGAVVIHAYADGMVPYDQTRELAAALQLHEVPTALYSVVGRDCRLNHEGNTTIIGYTGQNPECLAGHARESLSDHVVMRTAFDALFALIAGTRTPQGWTEYVIDEP